MERYVTIGTVKPLGWTCGALFAACSFFAFRAGQPGSALAFLAFVLLGAYLVYGGYSRYSVDSTALTSVSPRGRRSQLAWSEVKWVEVGTGGTLVFHAEGKRLVLPPPAMWRGPARPQLFQELVDELERRKLVPVPSNTADYKINKNVCVDDMA